MDLISVEQKDSQEFTVSIRKHQFTSDMSLEDGGQDAGPSPTELVVGAFGACVGMVVARYCETIQCPTEGLEVYLTYQLADQPKRIEAIVVDLELPPSFPEDRLDAVQKVIQACPIHGTLFNPPRIDLSIDIG
jgi:uncharacterized OsmC-like protein